MRQLVGTRTYIALGLVSLVSSSLLAASFFGLIPDRVAAQREGRLALAESVAAASTALLSGSDPTRVDDLLRFILKRNEQLLSIALRREDGKLALAVGDHVRHWEAAESSDAGLAQVKVAIFSGTRPWGQLELRFSPLIKSGFAGILQTPLLQLIAFCALTCAMGFHIYLARVLRHLDPSKAIPGRVRSALDSLTEGLLVIDQKRNIVLANEAFVKLVGKTNEQLMGSLASTIAWTDASGAPLSVEEHPWERALDSGAVQRGSIIYLAQTDGQRLTFMVNCSPVLGSAGRPGGVLISLEDITLLEQSKMHLQEARDEAQAANRAKSEFLANMSHEIRTPMNAILGFTELLKRGYSKSERESKHYLNTIHASGRHLLQLINDILDLSKVESGHLEMEHVPVSPHQITAQVIVELGVKASEKGITLEMRGEGLLPPLIHGDSGRLRQVLLNLLSNAVKFTEKGGVTVVLHCSPEPADAVYSIEVHDTGIGIAKDQLESMFEPFIQGDASITRRFGGTGLGLTISRRFARAMGGDIHSASEPGKGSILTFTFRTGPETQVPRLPLERLLAVDVIDEAPKVPLRLPAARILVVDDGAENRELLALVLANQGVWVDEAENGQQALEKVSQGGYDLVLMDLQMPVLDGFVATRLMRERGIVIPIVALTANAMKGFEREVLLAGFTAYITKPIDIDALLEKLGELLGQTTVLTPPLVQHRPEELMPLSEVTQLPIRSRFAANARFAPIVRKFAARLDEQLSLAEQAIIADDLSKVAALAHWLAGAAGTVGYDEFTEPSRELERSALSQHTSNTSEALRKLQQMAKRLEMPAVEAMTEHATPASRKTK